MARLANVIVALIALLHVYIPILEMFFWESPTSLRAFGLNPETAMSKNVVNQTEIHVPSFRPQSV